MTQGRAFADPKGDKMKKKVSIEDFASIKALGNLTLSPEGDKIAFTVKEGDLENNNYRTDIWVYDPARSPALYRLTAGEDGSAPLFKDNDTILFAADRKKRHPADVFGKPTVINRISLKGGEAEEYFVLPFAASALTPLSREEFLCSGKRDLHVEGLLAKAGKDAAKKEALKKQLEEEKDYEVFDELPFWKNGQGVTNKCRSGLFLCDIRQNTQKLLTRPFFDLEGFALSKDKSLLLYWGNEYESLRLKNEQLFLRHMKSGKVTRIKTGRGFSVSRAFFLGKKMFCFGTQGKKMGTSQNDEFYAISEEGRLQRIASPDISFGPVGSDIAGGGSSQPGGSALYFIQTEGYRSFYKKMDARGQIKRICDGTEIISAAVGDETDCYFIGMEKDRPQELYRQTEGKIQCLSAFNEAYVKEHAIGKTKYLPCRDREGTDLDGFVLYPPDFDPKKQYPAILTVHGGPRSAYGQGFFQEFQYWAACGYIVFFCNPPGSSGKGDEFADILGEKFGVRDYNALMDFTDAVLKKVPQIDPARLAMTGGSYGGFMANWIIGHTDRFKAVVSCRSISNYVSKCLTTDIGYYHNLSQMGTDPWENEPMLWAHSPLAYADKVKTPTLFIQSDEDYRCWMGDAVQMLQALLLHGVPARMCLFHGENHELSRSGKPKHRLRRLKEMTAWFDRYC